MIYNPCSDVLSLPHRETKQKTLEEIAAAFGDKVVLVDDVQRASEDLVVGKGLKPDAQEVEGGSTP